MWRATGWREACRGKTGTDNAAAAREKAWNGGIFLGAYGACSREGQGEMPRRPGISFRLLISM